MMCREPATDPRYSAVLGSHLVQTWYSVLLYQVQPPLPRLPAELYPGRRMAAGEWREYVAGWGSGIVNIGVTFPVNKTMFRQQLHGISALEAFRQLRSEVRNSPRRVADQPCYH